MVQSKAFSEVSERFKEPVSKTGAPPCGVPRVRIPPSPPRALAETAPGNECLFCQGLFGLRAVSCKPESPCLNSPGEWVCFAAFYVIHDIGKPSIFDFIHRNPLYWQTPCFGFGASTFSHQHHNPPQFPGIRFKNQVLPSSPAFKTLRIVRFYQVFSGFLSG